MFYSLSSGGCNRRGVRSKVPIWRIALPALTPILTEAANAKKGNKSLQSIEIVNFMNQRQIQMRFTELCFEGKR